MPNKQAEAAQRRSGQQLAAARAAAFAFGRCCDLYQDGLGQFHCHACGQATFAMLVEVQKVLGDGSESAMNHEESVRAALIRNAAPNMKAELDQTISDMQSLANSTYDPVIVEIANQVADRHAAAIAKAEGTAHAD